MAGEEAGGGLVAGVLTARSRAKPPEGCEASHAVTRASLAVVRDSIPVRRVATGRMRASPAVKRASFAVVHDSIAVARDATGVMRHFPRRRASSTRSRARSRCSRACRHASHLLIPVPSCATSPQSRTTAKSLARDGIGVAHCFPRAWARLSCSRCSAIATARDLDEKLWPACRRSRLRANMVQSCMVLNAFRHR